MKSKDELALEHYADCYYKLCLARQNIIDRIYECQENNNEKRVK